MEMMEPAICSGYWWWLFQFVQIMEPAICGGAANLYLEPVVSGGGCLCKSVVTGDACLQ